MTIHSNLMTSNKNFQKAEIVTLSDPIGEFGPHLLDTYIITYFFFLLIVHLSTMDRYIRKGVPMNTNITFNYEVPYM